MDEDDMKVDLISDLPPRIIELILTELPIKDVVRTNVLSKKWRNKWKTIPNLEFNDSCVDSCSQSGFENFITHCLFLHEGPIHKFVLQSSFLQYTPAVDQWLLFLSRKGIKELSIQLAEDEFFRAHSCLFTCSKLTNLKLVQCEIAPPPSFNGFLFLKGLDLQSMLTPDRNVIQSLISSCQLLQSLCLWSCDGLELTLCAPNLKYLNLDGFYKDIYLENTPRLISVFVSVVMDDDELFEDNLNCKLVRFFGRIPCLESLVGQLDFTYYLTMGFERRCRMSITYDHLKSIELEKISFVDVECVWDLLFLILNSPNLEKLQLSGCYSSSTASAFLDWRAWEEKYCSEEHIFSRLKIVKLTKVFGLMDEMEFI